MRLFAYKMTHDTGFAPNPFWGWMTLATCKSQIRRCKYPGDWIAGFTSRTLCDDPVGGERLVFLMQVQEKMTLAEYFGDGRFRSKIPRDSRVAHVHSEGDNIYRPLVLNAREAHHFEQLANPNHTAADHDDDVNGGYVLISKRFVYFGVNALRIPPHARPEVPARQSGHGTRTTDLARATRFIEYVFSVADAAVMANPHSWPSTDGSWKTDAIEVADREHPVIETDSSSGSERPGAVLSQDGCARVRHQKWGQVVATSGHARPVATSCSPRKTTALPLTRREIDKAQVGFRHEEPVPVRGTSLQRRAARRLTRRLRHSRTTILSGQMLRTEWKDRTATFKVEGDFPRPTVTASPIQDQELVLKIARVLVNRQ